MMRTIDLLLLTAALCLHSPAGFAKKPVIGAGLELIRKQTVEAHLAFLASDALEGREAGKRRRSISGPN